MTTRKWGVIAALVALALAGALVAGLVAAWRGGRGGGEEPKPPVLLLTSLPVLFGDGFGLDTPSSPLLEALRQRYTVAAIAVTDPASLARGRRLVMAQPRAEAPENLVALDQWVRGGGRLLLFADPRLEWPSDLPLGDLGRPPPMFADTGLLAHWGLRLDAPDRPGPVTMVVGGQRTATMSVGILVRTGGDCVVTSDGLVANCAIGKGRAIIVADADLLREPANRPAIAALLGQLG